MPTLDPHKVMLGATAKYRETYVEHSFLAFIKRWKLVESVRSSGFTLHIDTADEPEAVLVNGHEYVKKQ